MKVIYMGNLQLVDIYSLKRHEEISYERLFKVLEEIKKDGFIRNPVVVDYKTRVVLDGHHRLCALKMMGVSKCPVFFVDYFAKEVKLFPRRKEYAEISKNDVIRMGKSKKVFPNKTTRHLIKAELTNIGVRLKTLI